MINLTAQIDNDLAKLASDQVPFAASLALNTTAVGARDLVREGLPKKFRLTGNRMPRSIQAVMSNKTNLTASVVAPGYLAIHETGGTVRPTSSSLLAAKAPGISNRVLRAANSGGNTFRVEMGGNAAIFERKGRRTRLLAWLSPEHTYEERLSMGQDVTEFTHERFSHNFAMAFSRALASK